MHMFILSENDHLKNYALILYKFFQNVIPERIVANLLAQVSHFEKVQIHRFFTPPNVNGHFTIKDVNVESPGRLTLFCRSAQKCAVLTKFCYFNSRNLILTIPSTPTPLL